jgi:hypothetical protein
MGNDYKKQTSTISAKTALETLLSHGFKICQVRELVTIDDIPKAYRKDVLQARRQYGERAAISKTGRSIVLEGFHATKKIPTIIDLPLEGMLGHGALEAIQDKSGIALVNH